MVPAKWTRRVFNSIASSSQERNLAISHQDQKDISTNLQTSKDILGGLFEEAKKYSRHGIESLHPTTITLIALICWERSPDVLIRCVSSVVNRVLGLREKATRQGIMKAIADREKESVDIAVRYCATLVSNADPPLKGPTRCSPTKRTWAFRLMNRFLGLLGNGSIGGYTALIT